MVGNRACQLESCLSSQFRLSQHAPVHLKLRGAAVELAVRGYEVSDAAPVLHALIGKGMTPQGPNGQHHCFCQLALLQARPPEDKKVII